ncbi:MAG: hypothetical protein M1824_001926 [Vezdaea acicularis]|nr:MAG: hypothetical protein M1824_001926 [Vezdaea acicularis]
MAANSINGATVPLSTDSQGGRRPSLPHHHSADKHHLLASNLAVKKGGVDDTKNSPGRRGSWLSSLQSKFTNNPSLQSSTTPPATPSKAPQEKAVPHDADGIPRPPIHHSATALLPPGKERNSDDLSPYVPSPPAAKNPSFLQNALRRLSSSGPGSLSGKMAGTGGLVERRVMNKDPNRERCRIEELDVGKLRRVAFCVDVEIAGGPHYQTDADAKDKKKKDKDIRMKEKGEGATLKNPEAAATEKEKDGMVTVDGEPVEDVSKEAPDGKPVVEEDKKDSTRKKEKKKRSEEERKERKEKKRRQAEDDGKIPMEMTREVKDNSSASTTPPGATTPKCSDRPTTDPVRIYRRCCQLRETGILKKVTEQLSHPAACAAATPGVVTCLNLSGYKIPFQDVITLGDFLAVVPVKKVVLEDCGLGDESVRVILAGLLSARAPVGSQLGKRTSRENKELEEKIPERYGVVEKLILKNNPNIGRTGWGHISLFLHMSHSIKAIDLSGIPFPATTSNSTPSGSHDSFYNNKKLPEDCMVIFARAIKERLAGPHFEELVMAECNLTTTHIGQIVDAVIVSGLTRLGLASNHITMEGLEHVARFIKAAKCEGLDLGGNDLRELQHILANAFTEQTPTYALSLADCNLTVSALSTLFPALTKLPNFRFLDLSQNKSLFSTPSNATNALYLLRSYLPKLRLLKRIHLTNIDMSPDHAIALAEILPEVPTLAHLNILENPQLTALASAKDEAGQEEACALYASLMAAARVSNSLVSIDIDVPSPESSDVVKALAKQVVAYSLRNMERGACADIAPPENEKAVAIPDVLIHLIGHQEGYPENHDNDPPAPDDDYVIGGTGVVKALGICLNSRLRDSGRNGKERTESPNGAGSGYITPVKDLQGAEIGDVKAKKMSENLLGSARKIRARLQPALVKEAKSGNDMSFRRLLFLDNTLAGVIRRFEDEYPETRLQPPSPEPTSPSAVEGEVSPSSSLPDQASLDSADAPVSSVTTTEALPIVSDDEDDPEDTMHAHLQRHDSNVSLASRALSIEEGRMHRFGQTMRREILRPQTLDHAHGTTGEETDPEHVALLREKLESLSGPEVKSKINTLGVETTLREMEKSMEELRRLEREDPEQFKASREQHLATLSRKLEDMSGEEIKQAVSGMSVEAALAKIGASRAELQRLQAEDPDSWNSLTEAQRNAQEAGAGSRP